MKEFIEEFLEELKVVLVVICFVITPIVIGVFSIVLSLKNYFNNSISAVALFILGSSLILFSLFIIWAIFRGRGVN